MRFRWRCDRDAYEAFTRRSEGVIEGRGGERWAMVDDGRAGVYPDGLVYLETRGARLVDTGDAHGLLEPGRLPLAERAASVLVAGEVGGDVGAATLGRADLASELRFDDGREGLAFLHALAHSDVARGKVGTEGVKGELVETVTVRGMRGRSIQARAYDKGVESGTAGPGERIRFERQLRFRKSREQDVGQFLASDLRARFLGGLGRVADSGDVVVADVVEALHVLGELDIPASRRNRLAGFVLYGGRRADYIGANGRPSSAYYRARRELVELGIALDPALVGRVTVPMGDYLSALARPWQQAA